MDPFEALVPREYENIVLAFAGTRITSRAAQVPPHPATAILAKDRIKNGEVASGAILVHRIDCAGLQVALFSGHAAWHQLVWLVLPLFLAFYLCVVVGAILTSTRHNSTIAAYFHQVTHRYSSKELQQRHGVVLRVLGTLIRPACALGTLGVLLLALNLIFPQVCGGDCGSDPFVRTTSASIRQQPSIAYQYCWVTLSCAVTAVLICTTQDLQRCQRIRQAVLLIKTLMFVVEKSSVQRTAITMWQEKAGVQLDHQRVQLSRRAIVMVLTVPLLILSSLPAIAFVMSQK